MESFIHPKTGSTFVHVPAGEYPMGEDREGDAAPAHTVTLPEFWIQRDPVTRGEYRAFCVATGKPFPKTSWCGHREVSDEWPITDVSWFDAKSYCDWAGLRLPTEAEWEAAARGPDGNKYPWGNEDPKADTCNWAPAGIGHPTPAGQFPKCTSWCGARDMAGNVWEWCNDIYDPQAYEKRIASGNAKPIDPYAGKTREELIAMLKAK